MRKEGNLRFRGIQRQIWVFLPEGQRPVHFLLPFICAFCIGTNSTLSAIRPWGGRNQISVGEIAAVQDAKLFKFFRRMLSKARVDRTSCSERICWERRWWAVCHMAFLDRFAFSAKGITFLCCVRLTACKRDRVSVKSDLCLTSLSVFYHRLFCLSLNRWFNVLSLEKGFFSSVFPGGFVFLLTGHIITHVPPFRNKPVV